jgi:hypothetical protein
MDTLQNILDAATNHERTADPQGGQELVGRQGYTAAGFGKMSS